MKRLFLIAVLVVGMLIPVAPATAAHRPAQGWCDQWHRAALKAGWKRSDLRVLDFIMYRESKCQPRAIGWNYRSGKSHRDCKPSRFARYVRCSAVRSWDSGLTQVNSYWCRPSEYTGHGYLQDVGVLSLCRDLLDPSVNLRAARVLFEYSLKHNGCGWQPWGACGLRI